MKRTYRGHIRNAAICLTAIVSLAMLIVVLSQTAPATNITADQQQRQQRARPEPKVKVGELALDFELPILTFDTNAAGKPIGKISNNNKIRLSDYFGKIPVCMIMSSYT